MKRGDLGSFDDWKLKLRWAWFMGETLCCVLGILTISLALLYLAKVPDAG